MGKYYCQPSCRHCRGCKGLIVGNQLSLFESTKADTGNILRLFTSEDRRNAPVAFALAKSQSVSITELLIQAIQENWQRDWLKAWEGLEDTGYMTFANFNFGHTTIEVIEKDCSLSMNSIELYEILESDEFNGKLTKKYISKVVDYIRSHRAQIEDMVRGKIFVTS